MKQAANNPTTNALPSGVTEAQVAAAVRRSGYPLQVHVGRLIRQIGMGDYHFDVQDEWGYVDRDTHELRNLDLHAAMRLHSWDPQPRVRPRLDLLIECKQSELPYVFFCADGKILSNTTPAIAGLHQDKVVITSDDDPSTWTDPVMSALDLVSEPFQTAPTFCHTLSKCARKGSELELSGSDAYNGLVLPLIKAIQHFARSEEPPRTAWYFDCHICVGLAVLDAPIIGLSVASDGATVQKAIPWCRIARHEYDESAERFDRDKLWLLDAVHKDFLAEYLNEHLLPFASTFAERVLRHPTELATGTAFAAGMGADSFNGIEARLKPRNLGASAKRGLSIGSRILSLFNSRRGESGTQSAT